MKPLCFFYCRTRDKETPLQLAIRRHLPRVVEALCEKNVDMSVVNEQGNCPLWASLESGQEEIAAILVCKMFCSNFIFVGELEIMNRVLIVAGTVQM